MTDWKLEAGNWKLETGGCLLKTETGDLAVKAPGPESRISWLS
jgi:hypothetical protein